MRDEDYMREALCLAREAYKQGEIPVGAVVVVNEEIISRAHNEKERLNDATAHAEILALQRAVQVKGNWRLNDAVLYCTLEPCAMCAGAMVNARLGKLVFGARDSKAGAAGSIMDLVRAPWFNHQVEVKEGLLKEECAELLTRFFAKIRRDG
ncbi:MAG: tRNA adenosine(34) deaminase TadA [Syntrophomonadaceae bacterium]|jgi:tRNA(adenine34) deaminase